MTTESTFEGWAVLEILGHRRLIGFLSAVTFAGAPFVCIDVLQSDGASATQYYSPQAIYAWAPTTEETARRAASLNTVAPITRWELPALAPPATQSDDDWAADVADFLNRYTNGYLALDSEILDLLDKAIEQAANARVAEQDSGDYETPLTSSW